jgi:hypothetical protein
LSSRSSFTYICFPDAVQHEVVHRCSGTFADSEFVTIPVLQRTTPLRFVLRCARETQKSTLRRNSSTVAAG